MAIELAEATAHLGSEALSTEESRAVRLFASGAIRMKDVLRGAKEPASLLTTNDGGHLRGDRAQRTPSDPIQESLRRVNEA